MLRCPHDHELISHNACNVTQNEHGYYLKRVRINNYIKFTLSCQRIHYFALMNVPFRLESKSLTDTLGSRSHKIMHMGKTFSAISSKRHQAMKVISDTGMYLNSLQLDCKLSLSVPQNQRSGRGNTKLSSEAETGCILFRNATLKTSRLITICLLLSPDSLFLILNCIRH